MIFTETPVSGAFVIDVKRIGDERGFFGRLWCEKEFEDQGLVSHIKQSNIGFSPLAGTLRGLHYQTSPYQEVKIVRCTRGAVFDVVVDLRPDSPTFKKWYGLELNPENASMLYVPEGCATGYLTLKNDSEIYYHTSEFYAPQHATGVKYDDPAFGIEWPGEIKVLSDNDQNWSYFQV
ncbi:MAG: dTDP-4-dehydrorhamnose 3,5-epimerase [Gammaproteobacteria bacterium]|nr:dTDP-4-dehydrorhamnose 3,5-epimerase [Gammaproteobacteria bacterium]